MQTSPWPPAPTPELVALSPLPGESGLDALTRVGDGIVTEAGGSDAKDSRKDKKLPRQLAALVALRAQGFDNTEIAEKLGVDKRKLKSLINKAMRDYGWSDMADKLANVAVPLAMESVIKHLEHESTQMARVNGQHTMTRDVMKGVGIFKSHSAVKQESKSENTNILRVEVILPTLPPGVQALQIADGSILATPRRALAIAESIPAASIDGEVIK